MYVASYITTIVAVVVIFIKDVVQLCKDLNSAKDAKDVVNSFNMYRKYLLTTMNNYRKVIEALDKGLDKKMAK
jgi:undecaprenyl pyrophosphate phosphatase UppP